MDDFSNMKMEEIKSEEDEPKKVRPLALKRQIPPLQQSMNRINQSMFRTGSAMRP